MRSAWTFGPSERSVCLDPLHPAQRDPVGVPVVEQRRDRLGEQLVQRDGLELVAPDRVGHAVGGRYLPAVRAVVPLVPPAVPDREVQPAVQRRLHARGAAGLERPQRVVQPDVAALHQGVRHGHVVVGQEHDPAPHVGGVGELDQLLDQGLAALVGGMRLARHHDLQRPGRVVQQLAELRGIVQHQREPLVGRHPAGEPDRQHVVVEHVVDPGQFGAGRAPLAPGGAQPPPGLGDQPGAQQRAWPPTARRPGRSRPAPSPSRWPRRVRYRSGTRSPAPPRWGCARRW